MTVPATPYAPPAFEAEDHAEEAPVCPPAPEATAGAEVDPVLAELRELRIEQAGVCGAVVGVLGEMRDRQWWEVSEAAVSRELLADMRVAGGDQLEVSEQSKALLVQVLETVGGTLRVETAGGVEVENPPDVQAVRAAVIEANETANQNLWAIFGMVVGFGLLAVIFKLVRP